VCSVLAADILRYAEQSVELQAAWKARLNGCLSRAMRELSEADRVVLDSPSGFCVCFLGDPDGAMSCALALLGMVLREQSADKMRVRFGMHLGAVKLLRDINGNLNALGDGLHVAQRMMGFAGEDQILVSRSFHDVASCLSDAYRPLFAFAGMRRDEQMREHAAYELHLPALPHAERSASFEHLPRPPGILDPAIGSAIERQAASILGPIAHHLARTVGARAASPRELGEALAAFMPVSGDRDAFMRFCSSDPSFTAVREPSVPVAAAPSPAPAPFAFSPAVLARAGQHLAGYVGPMARILVSRTSGMARSEEELYDLLAAEIHSGEEREEFRRKGPRRQR
jgi:class 3 adenylate cyclase